MKNLLILFALIILSCETEPINPTQIDPKIINGSILTECVECWIRRTGGENPLKSFGDTNLKFEVDSIQFVSYMVTSRDPFYVIFVYGDDTVKNYQVTANKNGIYRSYWDNGK